MCDTHDSAIYDDLNRRQKFPTPILETKKSGLIYLEDRSTDMTIAERTSNVFRSPKSLATSTNTAFGYTEDDGFSSWEIIPSGIDILVNHGRPAGCDVPWKALWKVAQCFMSLGTCILPTGPLP